VLADVVPMLFDALKSAQVALALQHFSLKSVDVAAAPLFVGSRNLPVSQVPATPLHLVVSLSQHSDSSHGAMVHCFVAALVISFRPALHVTLSHLTLATQQFAL
jgi:hypothetical protein